MKMLHTKKGFTMMEMLIVVTIIAILASVVLPRFVTTSAAAKDSVHKAEVQTINSQIELFTFHTGTSPSAMTNDGWSSSAPPVNYREFWPEGVPTSSVYEKAWVINPVTSRVDPHNEE